VFLLVIFQNIKNIPEYSNQYRSFAVKDNNWEPAGLKRQYC
jgi:hypothetical protein